METEEELLNLELKFAFVCRGKLRDFYVLKKYIENLNGVELVYMTKSMDKLFIVREGEMNGKRRMV